uniref:alpha-L-fucosidase n=1 Tax=Macrostomum lignano TaxID=282301 RepID=A0A1I8F990_9PLAT
STNSFLQFSNSFLANSFLQFYQLLLQFYNFLIPQSTNSLQFYQLLPAQFYSFPASLRHVPPVLPAASTAAVVAAPPGWPAAARYEPNWQSLDSRPLPGWYDQAKIGVFIHWGVFSVPGFGNEWFWWRWRGVYRLLCGLSSRLWTLWRQTIRRDSPMPTLPGYCLWNTSHSFNWNSAQVGSSVAILLARTGCRYSKSQRRPRFGVYHSLYEWYNPLYLTDAQKTYFVRYKTMAELYELVNQYRPEVIWSDGDAGIPEYWNSTSSLGLAVQRQSTVRDSVVTNEQVGLRPRVQTLAAILHLPGRLQPGKLSVSYKFEGTYEPIKEAGATCYYTSRPDLAQCTPSCMSRALQRLAPGPSALASPNSPPRQAPTPPCLGCPTARSACPASPTGRGVRSQYDSALTGQLSGSALSGPGGPWVVKINACC